MTRGFVSLQICHPFLGCDDYRVCHLRDLRFVTFLGCNNYLGLSLIDVSPYLGCDDYRVYRLFLFLQYCQVPFLT